VIDPKEFTKYLKYVVGYKSPFVPKDEFEMNDEQTGFVLRLFSISTFGGIAHYPLGADGIGLISNPKDVEIKSHQQPFRMAAFTAYSWLFNLMLEKLPDGIVAYLKPVSVIADGGLIFNESNIKTGVIKSTVFPGRNLDIYSDYPAANLYFDKLYRKASKKE
jgi:hypothetical protein